MNLFNKRVMVLHIQGAAWSAGGAFCLFCYFQNGLSSLGINSLMLPISSVLFVWGVRQTIQAMLIDDSSRQQKRNK